MPSSASSSWVPTGVAATRANPVRPSMEPTSVSISFPERSFSDVQGTSGIKIDDTWILTSGLLPMLISDKNSEILDFIRTLEPGVLTCFSSTKNISNVRVCVTSRAGPRASRTIGTNETSVNSEIIETEGRICGAWRCPLLSETLDDLFRGWTFNGTSSSRETDKDLLTIFLLVRLCEDAGFSESEMLESAEISLSHLLRMCQPLVLSGRGVHVLIESTPFGNPVFIDSISRGIVSNVLGLHDCVMLTDANAAPGCEGGPVYVSRSDGGRVICGMVIAPLSWCRGEWVDYTLVARIVPCLARLLQKHNIGHFTESYKGTAVGEMLDKSVVLVRCGAEWGTGIVLDHDTGTILTCSHVVDEAPERRIKVVLHRCDNKKSSGISGVWAKLVYRTARGQAYDVAILSVDTRVMDPTLRPLQLADGEVEKGETVVSAGFPFFPSARPTITRGNISRVSTSMLQTTCCVQSGASGGPIVRSTTGELLGMVVCNIITSKTLHPRLNMAIPIAAIRKPISDYIKTGRVDALSALTNHDAAVCDAWNFHLPSKI